MKFPRYSHRALGWTAALHFSALIATIVIARSTSGAGPVPTFYDTIVKILVAPGFWIVTHFPLSNDGDFNGYEFLITFPGSTVIWANLAGFLWPLISWPFAALAKNSRADSPPDNRNV